MREPSKPTECLVSIDAVVHRVGVAKVIAILNPDSCQIAPPSGSTVSVAPLVYWLISIYTFIIMAGVVVASVFASVLSYNLLNGLLSHC